MKYTPVLCFLFASQLVSAADETKPKKSTVARIKPQVAKPEPTDFQTTPVPFQFSAHQIRSLEFSHDDKLLAVGHGRWDTPGGVRLWNVKARKQVLFINEGAGIPTLSFSPDNKMLVINQWRGKVFFRSTKTGKELPTHKFGIKAVRSALSPDGKLLLTANRGTSLQLWDAATGRKVKELKPQGKPFAFRYLAFSRDGKMVCAGGGDFGPKRFGKAVVWDVKTGKQISALAGLAGPVGGMSFSPDGKSIAAGMFGTNPVVWDVRTGKQRFSMAGQRLAVQAAGYSPGGNLIATVGDGSTVYIRDARNGQVLATLFGHIGKVLTLSFSRDGKTLATAGEGAIVRLWDMATFKQIAMLTPDAGLDVPQPVLALACSPNGKLLASTNGDKTIRLRDAASGALIRILEGHNDVAASVAFSPDGKTLASGSYDRTIKLWDVTTGKVLKTLAGHTNWIYSVAFSHDGKTLASGGYDKTIRTWNVQTGKPRATLAGQTASVRTVAFSPDGSILAGAGGDRSVKLFSAATHKELATLSGHKAGIRSIVFSPDGKTLASGSEDKTIKLWDVAHLQARRERSDQRQLRQDVESVEGEVRFHQRR